MSNATLSDDNWHKILDFLKGKKVVYIGTTESCCQFVDAVLWILRSGAQL